MNNSPFYSYLLGFLFALSTAASRCSVSSPRFMSTFKKPLLLSKNSVTRLSYELDTLSQWPVATAVVLGVFVQTPATSHVSFHNPAFHVYLLFTIYSRKIFDFVTTLYIRVYAVTHCSTYKCQASRLLENTVLT